MPIDPSFLDRPGSVWKSDFKRHVVEPLAAEIEALKAWARDEVLALPAIADPDGGEAVAVQRADTADKGRVTLAQIAALAPAPAFAGLAGQPGDNAALAAALAGKQAADATLTALAGVTTAADRLIYSTGVDAFATTALTPLGRSLLGAGTADAMRATLDLGGLAVKDRAAIADVEGLQAALDELEAAGAVSAHAAAADPHPQYQLESGRNAAGGYAGLEADGRLLAAQLPAHGHAIADIAGLAEALADAGGGGSGSTDWADIAGKPASYPPAAHGHAIAEVSGLQAALDGKEPAGTAAGSLATHLAAGDPHGQYQLKSARNAANGYAGLGADGKIAAAQLPAHGHGASEITSGTLAPARLPLATTAAAGAMAAADKAKLDGIEPGATGDMTAAEIEAAYHARITAPTAGELSDGTGATTVRLWTPAQVRAAILAQAPVGEGGSGGSTTLASLTDVDVSGAVDGQALAWNAAAGQWRPGGTSHGIWAGGAGTVITAKDGTISPLLRWDRPGATVVDMPDPDAGLTKAVKFPDIGHGETTWAEFDVDAVGEDYRVTIRFKTDFAIGDALRIYIDGTIHSAQDDVAEFGELWLFLAEGRHTIRLAYEKDATGDAGTDSPYISMITIPGAGTAGDYAHGDTVEHDGRIWLCLASGSTEEPGTGGDWAVVGVAGTAWDDITDKPAEFPPAVHTHTTAQVDGLDGALAGKQAASAMLDAVAGLAATGLVARTAPGTLAARTIAAAPGGRILVTYGDGVSDNPTLDVAEGNLNLANLNGSLSSYQLADGAVTFAKLADLPANSLIGRGATAGDPEAIACTAAGRALLDDADAAAQRATLGAQGAHAQLTALANLAASGIVVRTGANTVAARSLAVGTGLSLTNADGIAGNPTLGVQQGSLSLSAFAGDLPTSRITGLDAALSGKAPATHQHAASDIATGTLDPARLPLATTTAAGAMAAADKAKLDGIEAGATADMTAAEIEAAYHGRVPEPTTTEIAAGIGTASRRWSVARVVEAINAHAAGGAGGATTLNGLTDVDTVTAPPADGQALTWDAGAGLWRPGDMAGGGGAVAWGDIADKPAAFPPAAHGHTIAEVSGLQGALDAKAAATHTHATAQVTGLDAALAGKQAASAMLDAVAGLAATGLVARTGTSAAAARTLTAGSGRITVTNGNGVGGNPTVDVAEASLVLANLGGDLPTARITGLDAALAGKQAGHAQLTALAGLATNGLVARTAANAVAGRTITAAAGGRITVTNGDGVAGNPTLDVDQSKLSLGSIGGTLPTAKVDGLDAALSGKVGTGLLGAAGGVATLDAGSRLTGTQLPAHGHAWAEITGKPTSFTPAAHGHAIAEVTDLAATLARLSHFALQINIPNPQAGDTFVLVTDYATALNLTGLVHQVTGGTSAGVSITVDGTDVPGLASLTVTTTRVTTAPTTNPHVVAAGAEVRVVVGTVTGAVSNLSLTLKGTR